MALTITIAGVDRTTLFEVGTLRISDTLNGRSTCSFVLADYTGAYTPADGSSVVVAAGATTIFAGSVDSVEEEMPTSTSGLLISKVSCVDYNQICDRHLVARIYSSQTLKAIVEDIVAQDLAGEGITAGAFVDIGPVIERAVFNYRTVTDAFNDLAELTGYAWYVDYAKALHFFPRETNYASFSIDDASSNFFDMKVRRSRDRYRNRQFIRAGLDLTDVRTESFAADGKSKTWTLAYPVGVAPTIVVDTNNLTDAETDLETGSGLWEPDHANTKSVVTDSALKLTGSWSLRIRSNAAGDMSARLTRYVPVIAGETYVALASFRAGATGRQVRCDIKWYDSNALLSTTTGTSTLDTTTGWTRVRTEGVAPPAAVYAKPVLYVVGCTAADEMQYVDQIRFLGKRSATVGIRDVDTGKEFYWNKGKPEITHADSERVLAGANRYQTNADGDYVGDTLYVTYQGQYPLLVSSQDDVEIAAKIAAEGGTGIYEEIENDEAIDTKALALDRAASLLRRFGSIPRTVTWQMEDDDGGFGLQAGQLVTITRSAHSLSGQFLIDSVTISDVGGQFLRYSVRALDGESLGGWADFFRKLADRGRKFVIRENEVLLLLRIFTDAFVLSDSLVVSSGALAVAQFDTAIVGYSEVAP